LPLLSARWPRLQGECLRHRPCRLPAKATALRTWPRSRRVRQQDIAATISRDPVALTDYWTDDAIRLGAGAPAEVGKKTIRESNERQTANKSFKVLSYVPETKDFTFLDGGWAVEWRTYTGSFVDSPGGEAKHIRGTVLMVLKKLPDGSWKCFRAMGSVVPGTRGKAGGL